jgi:sec-independent protein translocase protein TatA
MAFDDPIVWILILVVVVFLFGANKIPQFAKAIGQARSEWNSAAQDGKKPQSSPPTTSMQVPPPVSQPLSPDDPLYAAAEKEGIDIRGKTKSEIATELAWKLSKKQQS